MFRIGKAGTGLSCARCFARIVVRFPRNFTDRIELGAFLFKSRIVKVLVPAMNEFIFRKLGRRLARANARLGLRITCAHGAILPRVAQMLEQELTTIRASSDPPIAVRKLTCKSVG